MNLRYTRPALDDLETILDYIAAHSPQAATRVQSRIRAVTLLVAQHPRIGTRTDDPMIRRMTVLPYPYLIFYEIAADELVIHAIRHAARDPSTMPGAIP